MLFLCAEDSIKWCGCFAVLSMAPRLSIIVKVPRDDPVMTALPNN